METKIEAQKLDLLKYLVGKLFVKIFGRQMVTDQFYQCLMNH